MKDVVDIFVAGATNETVDERKNIKELANDMSSDYHSKGIHINARSYENFEDNQEKYNEFIVNEADVVVFVIKGGLGSHTQDEFIRAAKAYKSKRKPSIIVFIHKPSETDYVNGMVNGLMAGLLPNQYWVYYETPKELKELARDRIRKIIESKSEEVINNHSADFRGNSEGSNYNTNVPPRGYTCRKRWYCWIITVLCALLCIVAGGMIFTSLGTKTESKNELNNILVFAGGGSVERCIEKQSGNLINVNDYPNAIYINMPSSFAWFLLAEEINNHQKNIYCENGQEYTIVCLSAAKIKMDELEKKYGNDFFKAHYIIECSLNPDTLVVYVDTVSFREMVKERLVQDTSMISTKELAELVQHYEKYNLFSTSVGSGTMKAYQDCIHMRDTVFLENKIREQKINVYNEASLNQWFNEKGPRYVIMGSTCYFVKCLETYSRRNEYYRLKVVEDINKKEPVYVTKQMFLYFNSIADEQNTNNIRVPSNIMSFLKDLNIISHDTEVVITSPNVNPVNLENYITK